MPGQSFSPQDYAVPPTFGMGLYYDPVYGYIPLRPQIRRAIDLPSMQRLRRISQLSTVELVFPGATHNRLEHSVGVYHIATMVFQTLQQKQEDAKLRGEEFGPELLPAHLLAVQLGALFHDVGHGPYSHVFELFCLRNPTFAHLHHEKLTERLISEGFGIYRDIPAFLTGLQDQLQREGLPSAEFLSPKSIARIATGQSPPDDRYTFLSQIISDDCVDADRMDYLPRDALHCKVVSGAIDVWQIVHGFTLGQQRLLSGKVIWKLKIDSRAAKAVEALLSSRDLAYRMIYYHPTHRAAQEMMVAALYELAEKTQKFSQEELALLTDSELLQAFQDGTAFTKDIAQRILFRRLYEPLPFRINVGRDLDEGTQAKVLGLSRPKSKREYEVRCKAEDDLAQKLALGAHQRVLFDLEVIPVTHLDAYHEEVLYEEASGHSLSLMKALPHLELGHGRIALAGQIIDLHDRYMKECSDIQIALPFELIAECVGEMQRVLQTEGLMAEVEAIVSAGVQTVRAKPKKSRKKAELAAERPSLPLETNIMQLASKICREKLLCIFEDFVSFLGVSDPDMIRTLRERFISSVGYLLVSCCLQRPPAPFKQYAPEVSQPAVPTPESP